MANKLITELTAAGTIDGTESVHIMQGANSRKATLQAVANFITALLVDSAPGTLDTLNELAAALGDDPDFATTITNALAGKPPNSRAITAGAGLTGGGDLSADRTLAADIAVAADIRGKAASHLLDVPGIYAASAPVTLTDAATIAVDLNTGIHFTVTLGGNRTLGNPTNATVGQSGLIRVVQDGTGSRTLALSSDWEIAGGSAPELSSNANAVDLFSYLVYASGVVYLFQIGKDFS